jgi:hypothetical protein
MARWILADTKIPQNPDVIEVSVYRSHKKAQTYVYLPADQDYADLPEAFVEQFGEASAFLTFVLHAEKTLAQVDAGQVMAAIKSQGFFLQLPPQQDYQADGHQSDV